MARDTANIIIANRLEVEYLPSDGAITNVVHHDLDLYFQGQKMSEIYKYSYLQNGES